MSKPARTRCLRKGCQADAVPGQDFCGAHLTTAHQRLQELLAQEGPSLALERVIYRQMRWMKRLRWLLPLKLRWLRWRHPWRE